MKVTVYTFILIFIISACNYHDVADKQVINEAIRNGKQAQEGYARSLKFVEGWLTKTDSVSGLIPTNLTKSIDIWEPHNSAADNYPFMVLTTYLLDDSLFNGKMKEMLETERKLTSRVKSLPDIYSFSKRDFKSDELKMNQVIFGTSEYIKDGLIPLTEYLGKSPWQERMMEMLADLEPYLVKVDTLEELFSERPASVEEVNGNLLQLLSRNYWMTGNKKYIDWATRIGDYYLLGTHTLNNLDYLRIRDHGCEVISGLSELYVALHFTDSVKQGAYRQPFYSILDRVLEKGRNDDGLFYNAINPKTGTIIDSAIVDNWGYIFDAYYSVYLVDGKKEYRDAVLKGFKKLNEKYRNYPWEGSSHDGYADALESAINLYNREQIPELKDWIDSEMKVMFAMQQPDGIIGGWHGDGNFARTAIMYSLWKSQGAVVRPWRNDLILGAGKTDSGICFVLKCEKEWKGKLIFDAPRHKTNMHLPVDYPRINQFPEWFTAEEGISYKIESSSKELTRKYSGKELLDGIQIKLNAGEEMIFYVRF